MRDPVALAYSGRIDEAWRLACAQAASDEPFLAAQGLEALSVLGQQHGVRADAEAERLLVEHARGPLSRKAFEAAAGLESRVLEPLAVARLGAGEATWEVLRYASELPSHALAMALAQGWEALPERLLDEALLTSCAMPVTDAHEVDAWGERALMALSDRSADVRLAALRAVEMWQPADAYETCAALVEDPDERVRALAERVLEKLSPDQAGISDGA